MPSNNNKPKWKRGSNLQVNVTRRGSPPRRTPLRRRAGLPALTPPNSNNNSIHSANYRFVVDPKTKRAYYKRQVFFPVNMAPNFMERKPTMKKTMNRLRRGTNNSKQMANLRERMSRAGVGRKNAGLFSPRGQTRRRSPSSSPNFFENVKHLFKK